MFSPDQLGRVPKDLKPVAAVDPLAEARKTLAASLDPHVANPTTAKRLDAIEQLLASQVALD